MKHIVFTVLLFGIGLTASTQNIADNQIEQKVESLLAKMTLEEKLGQLNMRGTSSRVKGDLSEELKTLVRNAEAGSFLNVMRPDYVQELQRISVSESRNGIPLIFARDIIHGFKTIFPIPLGQAASWDREVAYNSARVSAIESTAQGIRWTFAPMLDLARDARWGRIAESPGEDPYLGSIIAKAAVEGFQGDGLDDPTSLAACAKHYVAYGAAEGGRDYNTTNIHEAELRNMYFPAFQAALEAGAPTVMTGFNEVNGVPASGSHFLLDEVLRGEWGFDGFVVSDWNSVTEMIPHGFAADEMHAAEIAVNAGLDMEMMSKSYENHLMELLKSGAVKESRIDFLVKNILRVKFKQNLFENPHYDTNQDAKLYDADHLAKAKDAAIKSTVLLKNENVLPLSSDKKIALIGPLAHAPREQLGTWTFDGDGDKSITPKMAFENAGINVNYAAGLTYSRDSDTALFDEAITSAKSSDVIVFVGGEEAILSGEAHSRADISLPGAQKELIHELAKLGKPILLVIMAGRPISIMNIESKLDAVMMMWHPGTMGGPALLDMLNGTQEPSGRLPVTWPKSGAQCPIYYNHKNTGRPATAESFVQLQDIPIGAWQSSLGNNSHYLDLGFTPQYPFGYGLGYGDVSYSNMKVDKTSFVAEETINISVDVTNKGDLDTKETIQLYIQDVVGSLTRPVKELKGFEQVNIAAGETKTVTISLHTDQLTFVNHTMKRVLEPGDFNLYIGGNSVDVLESKVTLIEK